jgi:uncharacterized protein YceK
VVPTSSSVAMRSWAFASSIGLDYPTSLLLDSW